MQCAHLSDREQLLLSIRLANCHFMSTNRVEDVIREEDVIGSHGLDLSSLSAGVFQIITTFNMHIQNSCQYLAWVRKSEHEQNVM